MSSHTWVPWTLFSSTLSIPTSHTVVPMTHLIPLNNGTLDLYMYLPSHQLLHTYIYPLKAHYYHSCPVIQCGPLIHPYHTGPLQHPPLPYRPTSTVWTHHPPFTVPALSDTAHKSRKCP